MKNRWQDALQLYAGAVPTPFAVYRPGIVGMAGVLPFELGICSYEIQDLDTIGRTGGIAGLTAYKDELIARRTELNAEAQGVPFNTEQREEFAALNEAIDGSTGIDARVTELEAREAALVTAGRDDRRTERPAAPRNGGHARRVPENVYDLAEYRRMVSSVDELAGAYRDGAMSVVEHLDFPNVDDQAAARGQISKLIARHRDDEHGDISRRVIATSQPAYVEAWLAHASGKNLTPKMQAALQTYTDADGGYAIPVVIDPTFILTSDGSVNPLREISRIETIVGKSWQPITTEGVTAAYVGERTTVGAADGAPDDIASPVATPVRADVALDVTLEYLQDYGAAALLSELGRIIQDAKDQLEAEKFLLGDGGGEPEGIIYALVTDATSIFPTAVDNTYTLNDLDALIAALGPRFRSKAHFLANLAIYQYTRGFGDAGQTAGSIYDAVSKILRGYPAHEASFMDGALTDAKRILAFGDFGTGFVIVDRIGLATKVVDTRDTNGRPTGGSTIYAAWRNTSKLLVPNAFRLLEIN
jgi:HK97 family phage major capsid protein